MLLRRMDEVMEGKSTEASSSVRSLSPQNIETSNEQDNDLETDQEILVVQPESEVHTTQEEHLEQPKVDTDPNLDTNIFHKLTEVTDKVEDHEQFFLCAVCKTNPVLAGSVPKLLPCLHSFCEKCIEVKYQQQKGTVDSNGNAVPPPRLKCPSCGQEFLVSSTNGISGFLNNQFTIEHSKTSPTEETSEQTCTSCDDESPADSFCQDCSEWLCQACVHAHQRVKVTKDHTIKPKEECNFPMPNGNSTNSAKPLFCKLHAHEQLKLFCASCDKLTCRDCQLVEHKDHRYQFIKEAALKHREVLKKLLQYLKVNLGLLNETVKEVEMVRKGLQIREKEIEAEITTTISTLIRALEQRRESLIGELHTLVQSKQDSLVKQTKDLTQMKVILAHNYDFCSYAVEHGSDVALLYCRKVLGTRMHNLNSLKYRQRPLAYNDVKFSLDTNKLCSCLAKTGTVYSQEDVQRKLEAYLPKTSAGRLPGVGSDQLIKAHSASGTDMATPRLTPLEALTAVNKRVSSTSMPFIVLSSKPTTTISHKPVTATRYGIPLKQNGSPLQAHSTVIADRRSLENRHLSTDSLNLSGASSFSSPSTHGKMLTKEELTARYLSHIKGYLSTTADSSSSHSSPVPSTSSQQGAFTNIYHSIRSPIITSVSSGRRSGEAASHSHSDDQTEGILRRISSPRDDSFQRTGARSSSSDPGPSGTAYQIGSNTVPIKQEKLDSPEDINGGTVTSQRPSFFTLNQEDATSAESGYDEGMTNDDYCAVCRNGGQLLCCDTCPKVFHLECHVPQLVQLPNDTWSCGMCEQVSSAGGREHSVESSLGEKRRSSQSGMSDQDLKICEKILLELFCYHDSLPFQHRVSKSVPQYYKIITKPMDLNTIKMKLQRQHFHHYQSIKEFIEDVRLIFANCAKFNPSDSEVARMGKSLELYFETVLDKHLPTSDEPRAKRRRDDAIVK